MPKLKTRSAAKKDLLLQVLINLKEILHLKNTI